PSPAESTVPIIRADESVPVSSTGSLEAASRGSRDVDVALAIRGDTVGMIDGVRAELTCPPKGAFAVVGANEGVRVAGAGACQGAVRMADHVDVPGGIHGNFGDVVVDGDHADTAEPAWTPFAVQRLEEAVRVGRLGRPHPSRSRADDIDVAGSIGGDAGGFVIATPIRLPRPAVAPTFVVGPDERVRAC